MSGFIFERNVWFRFCTKCLVSFLYEMSGSRFCTVQKRKPDISYKKDEMSCVRIVVPPEKL